MNAVLLVKLEQLRRLNTRLLVLVFLQRIARDKRFKP